MKALKVLALGLALGTLAINAEAKTSKPIDKHHNSALETKINKVFSLIESTDPSQKFHEPYCSIGDRIYTWITYSDSSSKTLMCGQGFGPYAIFIIDEGANGLGKGAFRGKEFQQDKMFFNDPQESFYVEYNELSKNIQHKADSLYNHYLDAGLLVLPDNVIK